MLTSQMSRVSFDDIPLEVVEYIFDLAVRNIDAHNGRPKHKAYLQLISKRTLAMARHCCFRSIKLLDLPKEGYQLLAQRVSQSVWLQQTVRHLHLEYGTADADAIAPHVGHRDCPL